MVGKKEDRRLWERERALQEIRDRRAGRHREPLTAEEVAANKGLEADMGALLRNTEKELARDSSRAAHLRGPVETLLARIHAAADAQAYAPEDDSGPDLSRLINRLETLLRVLDRIPSSAPVASPNDLGYSAPLVEGGAPMSQASNVSIAPLAKGVEAPNTSRRYGGRPKKITDVPVRVQVTVSRETYELFSQAMQGFGSVSQAHALGQLLRFSSWCLDRQDEGFTVVASGGTENDATTQDEGGTGTVSKLRIDLDRQTHELLLRVKDRLDAPSQATVFRRLVRLGTWYLNAIANGQRVVLKGADGIKEVEILIL